MTLTAIIGGTVLLPTGPLDEAVIAIADDEIEAVGPADSIEVPLEATVIDAGGLLVAPGLIDLQINGGFGVDVTEDPTTVWALGARLPEHGVTAFVPTLVSPEPATIRAAQATLAERPPAGWRGAIPLGWHVEGPFIASARRGVHPESRLRAPDRVLAREWRPETGVRIVTIAPELDGALDVITSLARAGVVVSLGHSAATYDEGRRGIEAGARYATHLFNAMPPLDHREPGLAGAVLADPRVTVGLIPDGVHVHPTVVDIVRRAVGPERLSIVTDAIAALGLPPGRATLAGVEVIVADGACRQVEDGRLAGSILRLDAAVHNLVSAAADGLEPTEALAAATRVPAHLLGERFRGVFAPGARADIALFDRDLELVGTIVGGEVLAGPWA